MRIKLLIVDDHAVVREGVKKTLQMESMDVQVREAANARDALKVLREEPVDIVLTDLFMDDIHGFELVRRIRLEKIKTSIIVFSIYPDVHFVTDLLQAGVNGFVSKDRVADDLARAIKTVLSNKKFICQAVAEELLEYSEEDMQLHTALSARQFVIMCMLGRGVEVADIADELLLSERTVRTEKENIFLKMGFSSHSDLIRYCIKQRLIT